MFRKHLGFFILTTILNSGFCIDSSTLKCSDLRNNGQLICVVFDLQIYHEMTKIKQIDDGMYGISYDALYMMSPLMYYLPTDIFSHFPNITELKIITDIPVLLDIDSTFNSLNQLITIQIINQKLRKLDSGEFQGANNVRSLYLTSNEIDNIHDDAFLGLVECKFLDLRNNRIRIIRMETLMHMPKLWSVNFGNNRIFTIFSNVFEKNSIRVADFSYNLIRIIESMDPIKKVLQPSERMALFSLRYQLCYRYGPKAIFTPKSIMQQIQPRLDACQLYYTPPTHCNNDCKACIRYDLVSEESEDDYDEYENWDGGIFGEGVKLPSGKLSDEDDPSYELVTLKAENSRLKSFCMSGNFSDSVTVHPSANTAVAQTCSTKIISMASVVSSVQNLLTEHQTALKGVIDELKDFSGEHGDAKSSDLRPTDMEVIESSLTTEPSDIETHGTDDTNEKLEESGMETDKDTTDATAEIPDSSKQGGDST